MNKETAHTGVLIVNLGTPDSPKVKDVRKYLREFLMDGRVIDIPTIPRWLLVNLIIAPFRSPKSAKIYKQLWTKRGSPLKYYGYDVEKLLQDTLGPSYDVKLAMRYQSPSIKDGLDALKVKGFKKIIVIPLFPHYASASSGSVHEKVMELVKVWQIIPEISFISNFYDHPTFLETLKEIAAPYIKETAYDHYIFSYHGLPERQIIKGDCTDTCLDEKHFPNGKIEAGCCATIHKDNQYCYRAQCFEHTKLMIEMMGISKDKVTTCFQSRLGKTPWIQPYTEDIITKLATEGKKSVLAFSPAFISDCLETTIEVGDEYKELFEEQGGEHWQLVESLNVNPMWIQTLKELVIDKS